LVTSCYLFNSLLQANGSAFCSTLPTARTTGPWPASATSPARPRTGSS
jgi:hypothetical protein